MGMVILLMVRFMFLSYSAGAGVKMVELHLSGFRIRLFDRVQLALI